MSLNTSKKPSSEPVIIDPRLYVSDAPNTILGLIPEVEAWCKANLRSPYTLNHFSTDLPDQKHNFSYEKGDDTEYKVSLLCKIKFIQVGIVFEDEVDSIHFKMRWVGS